MSQPPGSAVHHARLPALSRRLADRLVADTAALIAIPSVGGSPAEADAQRWVANRLSAVGANVRTWESDAGRLAGLPDAPGSEVDRTAVTGVFGSLAGRSSESVCLLGHTDVVPASEWPHAFQPHVAGDVVTGRGAADMKAAIAAMIHVVRVLVAAEQEPARTLTVATVSAEEDGGLGAFDLLHHLAADRPQACIIPEPTHGEVVVANAGALGFAITLHGRSAHAARRWEGLDALDLVAAVQQALRNLEAEDAARADPLLRRWPVPHPTSIGTIAGGDWASTVMASVRLTGRYGVPLDVSLATARQRFETVVNQAVATVDPAAIVRVEWEGGQFAPARIDPLHPLVLALRHSHRAVTGRDAAVTATTYGTDLRLVLGAGIPAVCYGPGDAEQAHAVDEHVSVGALLEWVDVILDLVTREERKPR